MRSFALLRQVRAFVKNKEGLAKQELNQSPLPFIESAAQTGVHLQRLTCDVPLPGLQLEVRPQRAVFLTL